MSKISMIAAIGKNRELGKNNQLVWRISSDLKRLKSLTMGHPIIMGRKTFESIGRVLPGRTNIIISRSVIPDLIGDPEVSINGLDSRLRGNDNTKVIVVNSIEQAIEKAKKSSGPDEIFILGGAQIFNQMIDRVDKLYLTVIDAEDPEADAFFPDYSEFTKIVRQEKNEENGLKFEYLDLER